MEQEGKINRDRERRHLTVMQVLVPTLCAILTVLVGVIGTGMVEALHDLTTEVRTLTGKLAVVQEDLNYGRVQREKDEINLQKLQDDVREIKAELNAITNTATRDRVFNNRKK